jgi:predicted DNA-binding protein with PD1-like motif
MKIHVFRLKPGEDMKVEIEKYVQLHKIKAGVILSGVGNIGQAKIRLANENIVKEFKDQWGFEIVSVTGTISISKNHVHISFSDKNAITFGGHIKEGCIVRVTAEIVIGEIQEYEFTREFDKESGFDELVAKQVNTNN